MLILKNIYKKYTNDTKSYALNNINLKFRNSEFVSILGPSGSGKTTLLNIIGGLDKYTKGNLIINNKSTKRFSDKLWDCYRNNMIGFIFQNYNLIEHITVLKNVEISLTLSNVNYKERRKIALNALKKVGLDKYANKSVKHLSGGQAQRVAIARAIVNNPSIILADEPTGALDSKTSIKIMELIKSVSKNKLVIMVSHNKALASKYSSRIITLEDGMVKSDSNKVNEKELCKKVKLKKTKMSFLSAIHLSISNLKTKKNRTILTSLASSIGIIGIALLLSISNGFKKQISIYEKDTLSKFPIVISENKIKETSKNKDKKIRDIDYTKALYGKRQIDEKFIEYIEKIDDKYLSATMYDRKIKLNLISFINNTYKIAKDINLFELPNNNYLKENYEIVKGRLPINENELVLILDDNKIDKNILDFLSIDEDNINLDHIVNSNFKLVNNNEFYTSKDDKVFLVNENLNYVYDNSNNKKLIITGIIKLKENDLNILSSGFIGNVKSSFGYLKSLSNNYVLNNKNSTIINSIKNNNDIIVQDIPIYEKEELLSILGDNLLPNNIYIYPKDYISKNLIIDYIKDYSRKKIYFTDYAKQISSLSNNLINGITIILIAFSSVSLIVSSIMISIITYISVLERTKEIGILRSLGARGVDITRLFNCENFIIGLLSGLIGILLSIILLKPINIILYNYSNIKNIGILSFKHSIMLILMSIILSLISGYIPSKMASKKDIVAALKA